MKTKLFPSAILLVSAILTSCQNKPTALVGDKNATPSSAQPNESSKAALVSIIALICNPTQYEGKHIQVIGFGHIKFEDMAVYLTGDDARYGITSNGIWLEIPKTDFAK